MILDHRPGQPDDAKWPREDLYDRDVDGLHMPFPPPISRARAARPRYTPDPAVDLLLRRQDQSLNGQASSHFWTTMGSGGVICIVIFMGFSTLGRQGCDDRRNVPVDRPFRVRPPIPQPIPPEVETPAPFTVVPAPFPTAGRVYRPFEVSGPMPEIPPNVLNLTPWQARPSVFPRAKSSPRSATRLFPPFPRRRPESP